MITTTRELEFIISVITHFLNYPDFFFIIKSQGGHQTEESFYWHEVIKNCYLAAPFLRIVRALMKRSNKRSPGYRFQVVLESNALPRAMTVVKSIRNFNWIESPLRELLFNISNYSSNIAKKLPIIWPMDWINLKRTRFRTELGWPVTIDIELILRLCSNNNIKRTTQTQPTNTQESKWIMKWINKKLLLLLYLCS